jgi:hypothetical protein
MPRQEGRIRNIKSQGKAQGVQRKNRLVFTVKKSLINPPVGTTKYFHKNLKG